MQKAIEIQGASEIDVDFDKELKSLVQRGALLKSEGREVEKLLMNNNPDDGITGGATLWKLAQASLPLHGNRNRNAVESCMKYPGN